MHETVRQRTQFFIYITAFISLGFLASATSLPIDTRSYSDMMFALMIQLFDLSGRDIGGLFP